MSLQRALTLTLISLVILGGALIILNIWGMLIRGDILFKLLATIGIQSKKCQPAFCRWLFGRSVRICGGIWRQLVAYE